MIGVNSMKIEFETSNAAFDEYGTYEVIRILDEIGRKLDNGYDHGVIMDINGNKVGEWSL